MKYFVCSDVHSYYTQLNNALVAAGYDKKDKNHIFVHCGDLLDRGDESLEVLKFVNSIPKSRKILIRGNHEDLLESCIHRREFSPADLHNGTLRTVFNVCGRDEDDYWFDDNYKTVFEDIRECKPLYKYLGSTQDCAEVDDYVFVHGWIPEGEDWRQGDWARARWTNGMAAWSRGAKIKGKTIVCGHWHTSWGHSRLHGVGTEWDGSSACFEPFKDDGILALDGCTTISNKVNVVVLDI